MADASNTWTFSKLSEATGLPIHRLRYVLASRGIEPIGTIGGVRIFAADALDRVREADREIRARRQPARDREVAAAGR